MIRQEERGSVIVLTLEHGKVNAFDLELVEALEASLGEAQDAGAVVITGAGRAFSAGVDLHRLLAGGESYVTSFVRALAHTFQQVAEFPRPLVAAVNGHAIAGGAVLAAAADLKLMSDGPGRIGAPELLVGVPFPAVALEILRFAWPGEHLQTLLFRGRMLTASEALAKGLVDEVLPEEALLETAVARARDLAAIPPRTFALSKRQMRQPLLERIARQEELHEAEVRKAWADPETLGVIRNYLDRTLGK